MSAAMSRVGWLLRFTMSLQSSERLSSVSHSTAWLDRIAGRDADSYAAANDIGRGGVQGAARWGFPPQSSLSLESTQMAAAPPSS